MNSDLPENRCDVGSFVPSEQEPFVGQEPILAELVDECPTVQGLRRPSLLRRRLPLILFAATCFTTFLAGSHLLEITLSAMSSGVRPPSGLLAEQCWVGFVYAACVMTILVCHEMGHYVQARRYHIPASLPFFIPMPIPPIGTMGAVIAMRPGVGDRRAIFDIGITGPLAGLVPTLIFCVVGLWNAEVKPISEAAQEFGEPLLMQFLAWLRFGPRPEGHDVIFNPMLFAAWVGLLVTSLNLIPIGQLDGGHVLYALLRKKAHFVASWLLKGAVVAVGAATIIYRQPVWILMVLLLLMMGPHHPPTANDNVPLGPVRVVLGWLTLAFILIGFTPIPMKF